MTDYTELVKALRCREAEWGYYTKCEYYGEASDNRCVRCDSDRLAKDAADAIEELDAEETRLLLITSELQDKVVELEEELNDADIAADDNARQVEELQARLGEAENSVERWKDMYLTKHEPKRGEWVEDTTTYYAGPGMSNYKCSLCGKICGTWRRGLKPSELPNWCGNCGAKMTEVQDETEIQG